MLTSRLPEVRFVPGDAVLTRAQAVKSDWELAKIRLCGARHATALRETIPAHIRPGMRFLRVRIKLDDGTLGWPDEAPFDRILVAAAGPKIPEPLLAQLADPGRMKLSRVLSCQDTPPENDWVQQLFSSFSWLTGVALVDTSGVAKFQAPASFIRPLDFAPLLELSDRYKARKLGAVVKTDEFGTVVMLAAPYFENNEWTGLIVAFFDPRSLLHFSPDPSALAVVSSDGTAWPGGSEQGASLASIQWDAILKSNVQGEMSAAGGKWIWVSRNLGQLHADEYRRHLRRRRYPLQILPSGGHGGGGRRLCRPGRPRLFDVAVFMGELHLDVVLERARREYGVSPRAGKPQVVYLETVTAEGRGDGEFDRELGEREHHGKVAVTVAPLPREAGRDIGFAIDSATFPAAWREAMDEAKALWTAIAGTGELHRGAKQTLEEALVARDGAIWPGLYYDRPVELSAWFPENAVWIVADPTRVKERLDEVEHGWRQFFETESKERGFPWPTTRVLWPGNMKWSTVP